MVTTVMSWQRLPRILRASSHSFPLTALSGSTKASTQSGRAFRNARSRKSAASPLLPVPIGAPPLSLASERCIRFCVALLVLKAANAGFPVPSFSASIPVGRTKGGFMITRSNLSWPTLDTRSRTLSGARPPADTAAAVSISDCCTVSASRSKEPIATLLFPCLP